MARTLLPGEKPLDWVGSSKKDFLGFPERVKDEMGNALGLAQFGGTHRRSHNRTTRSAMAKRKTEAKRVAETAITRGTGNVFADLGFPDAEERQTKLRLAYAINDVIERQRLTQAAAADKLGVNQPKVSALAHYKLDGFSVERLMTFLTALDQDVEIVIRKKPRSRTSARISVTAA
jgi:predicted XRE-type DNA-binding protein